MSGKEKLKNNGEWIRYVMGVYHTIYKKYFVWSDRQMNGGDEKTNLLTLYYGYKIPSGKNLLIILPGKLGEEKKLDIKGLTVDNVPVYHYRELPPWHTSRGYIDVVLKYVDGGVAAIYNRKQNSVILGADLLRTSFILLSREEEKNAELDEYGRFDYRKTIVRNIDVPIVNEYFYLLTLFHSIIMNYMTDSVNWPKNTYKKYVRNFRMVEIKDYAKYAGKNAVIWPNNAPYAVCLTHDVDVIYKWWLKKAISYILRGKGTEFLKSVGKGEYNNIEKIMALEAKYGFKSTFFFLTIKRDRMPRYNIKKLRTIIQSLIINKWEIGLHTSLGASVSVEKILKEKEILESVAGRQISGVRNHYLGYKYGVTWEIQYRAGFEYDSTMGYTKKIGFRTGICHPHCVYFPQKCKERQCMIELPMTIMDKTLEVEAREVYKEYGVSKKDAMIKKINNILRIIRMHKGLLVINWHQSSFDEKDYKELVEVYKWMLEKFKFDGAFVAPCYEVCEWWRDKMGDTIMRRNIYSPEKISHLLRIESVDETQQKEGKVHSEVERK